MISVSDPASPTSGGIRSTHHCITRSLLEKNLWPPMSIRLPLYLIVREIPPISSLASRRIGLISVRRSNSRPAVNPAGPAPIITAVLLIERDLLPKNSLQPVYVSLREGRNPDSSHQLDLRSPDFCIKLSTL